MTRRKQTYPILLILALIGGLALIVVAILLALRNDSPIAAPTLPASSQAEGTYPEIERVSLEEAKTALEAGSAVFVDVRAADVYALSHVPGALSVPLTEIQTRLDELDPNQWIITYCT